MDPAPAPDQPAAPPLPPELAQEEEAGVSGRFWSWYARRLPALGSILLPLALIPAPAVLSYLVLPEAAGKIWAVSILAVFAIDGALALGFTLDLVWWLVMGCVLWTEMLVLIWLLRNLDLLRVWPRFRRFVERREAKALAAYRKRRWARRSHLLGVALFVFLPLSSGIFAGTLVGRFTGLSNPRTFLAVMLGTVVWAAVISLAIYLSVDFWRPWLDAIMP